jgi:hypothetical protein
MTQYSALEYWLRYLQVVGESGVLFAPSVSAPRRLARRQEPLAEKSNKDQPTFGARRASRSRGTLASADAVG